MEGEAMSLAKGGEMIHFTILTLPQNLKGKGDEAEAAGLDVLVVRH
jgi:hypothetical protein